MSPCLGLTLHHPITLVSNCWYNKLPQIKRLKATQSYDLSVLETGNLKWFDRTAFLPERPVNILFTCSFQLQESSYLSEPVAGKTLIASVPSLPLIARSHRLWCFCLLLLRISVITLSLRQSRIIYSLKMLNLITSLASLLWCRKYIDRFWELEHGRLWGPCFSLWTY